MEGNPEEIVSTQKTLQSTHDPGWNDPPSWALSSSQQSVGTPTKRLLNKRVAFPLNPSSIPSSSPIQTTSPIVNTPPPAEVCNLTTAPHKPTLAPSGVNNENLDVDLNNDNALKDTLDNLNILIKQLDQSKAEEIQKRLDRMEVMWNENKLNSIVHKKLLDISTALKENNVEKADQLHISLMMNNASVCSSWIPGIRQLITEIRNKKM